MLIPFLTGLDLSVAIEQNGKSIPLARAGDTVDFGVTGIDATALRFVYVTVSLEVKG